MIFRTLQLNEFRNFDRLQLKLLPRVNFFVGENGQGKTNLLEAVYLLCRGKSFRPTNPESFLRRTEEGPVEAAKVLADAVGGEALNLDHKIEIKLEPGLRTSFVDGKRVVSGTLMSRFPIVLFSPESLSVIKDGPDERRSLIDEVILSHDQKNGRVIREFTRALRARNRLLWQLAEGLGSRSNLVDSLESLSKIFLLLGTHLATARIASLRDLMPDLQEAMRFIFSGEPENSSETSKLQISVDYVISGDSAMQWSESQIYDALHKRHSELAAQELSAGLSLVGPHKHDIKLLVSGNDSRFYCSQGQQRALILALKIAQIVYHHRVHRTYPVLLLDDVMSELDAKKRVNLMRFLDGISAQILITATDLTWPDQFGVGRSSVFEVVSGTVNRVT